MVSVFEYSGFGELFGEKISEPKLPRIGPGSEFVSPNHESQKYGTA
jgi:hypothetical protein